MNIACKNISNSTDNNRPISPFYIHFIQINSGLICIGMDAVSNSSVNFWVERVASANDCNQNQLINYYGGAASRGIISNFVC